MANPIFRLFLLLAAICQLSTPAFAETWSKATTPDFMIYSEGNPADLQTYAQNLERFDALLRARFGVTTKRESNPLTIYLLEKPKSVSRLLDRDHTAGFYSPASEGSYAIANRAADRGGKAMSGQMTLFHEYTHHFMYRQLGAPWPAWYREGIAEYLSTARLGSDGQWTLGAPPGRRLKRAKNSGIPMVEFLAADAPKVDARTPRDFYAQAWLLVHLLESRPDLKERLDSYLAAIAGGEDPRAAARRLGDPAELDAMLEAHAAMLGATLPAQANAAATAPDIAPLGEPEASLLELELARRTGRDVAGTRDALARLAEAFPGNAAVLYQFALAQRAAGDSASARATTDRLLSASPNHARAHLLKAELLAAAQGDKAAILQQLARAAELAPADPYVLAMRFRIATELGVPPSPEVLDEVARAFAMAPESSAIRLSQALALAFQRRFVEADALARVMAYDPHAGDTGRQLLQTLTNLRTHATPR